MEALTSFIPLIIFIVVIVVIVRWRRSVRYLKNPTVSDSKPNPTSESKAEVTTTSTYKPSVTTVSAEVGDVKIDLDVSDDEIESLMQEWAFVIEGKRPKQLTGADAWYKQRNQNKFLKTEPERALDWVLPFIPADVAKLERLKPHITKGLVDGAGRLHHELRTMFKERRKSGEPYIELLEALYGVAVMNKFDRSLNEVRIGQGHSAYTFVALKDLQDKPLDYQQLGYDQLSLMKTEIKWLVQEFGEPEQHMYVKDFYFDAWHLAIKRLLWKGLQQEWGLKGSASEVNANMKAWLREQLKNQVVMGRYWKEDEKQRSEKRAINQAQTAKRVSVFPGFAAMSLYKEKVVGVTQKNDDGKSRQKIISKMHDGETVDLVRDPDNPYGSDAIEVYTEQSNQIGFISADRASELAPQMDKGYKVEAWVDRIMGGESGKSYGVLIAIQRYKPARKG